jgi:hypothetical protein
LQLLLQGRHSIGKNVGRSLVLFAKRIPKDNGERMHRKPYMADGSGRKSDPPMGIGCGLKSFGEMP